VKFRAHTLISPIARFVTEEHIRTLLMLFSAIVFVFFTSKDYIPFIVRLVVPFLLLLLITASEMRQRFNLLLWITLGLALNVVMNFYVIANHGFVITYIGIALMIACASGEEASKNISRAAVFLISILMGLALIQKLISAHYMSGDLIGSYLANGYMFKTLISLVDPSWPQTVHQNLAAQKTLMNVAPAVSASMNVTIPPMIQVLAIVLTWMALVSQVLIEACVLLRNKIGVWAHFAIILFVLIIYSTRNENVFLAMNLIFGYAITNETTKSARLWYVIGIAYLMIMEAMGLRPGIIG
jgi:hypothetical protein